MLHIAICDDDSSASAEHKKITETCLSQMGSPGETISYTSSENCFMILQKMAFSLI